MSFGTYFSYFTANKLNVLERTLFLYLMESALFGRMSISSPFLGQISCMMMNTTYTSYFTLFSKISLEQIKSEHIKKCEMRIYFP